MNFNYKWNFREQNAKIDKLVLEHITKKWEKLDWRIKNTRDKKKYKIVDYQYRTRKTLYGMVTYKRRIYEYFDEKLQKWIRVCLVDEILQLPKYKRIGEDIEDTIIENFADGKRYRDIWALNQMPSLKSKLLNSSKKIILGLGTIGLANYSKWIENTITPVIPTTTISPITISTTTMSTTTTSTTQSTTTTMSTTPVDPFPPDLLLSISNNTNNSLQMDWDTYISLNAYGIANLVAGITELIPSKFETIRKIANMATGGALISSGVAMGINNDFTNAYAIPTIIAGASEIIHNLLPMETNRDNTELQETSFTNERANLINASVNDYGSRDSIDSLTSDVIYERPVYCPTTIPIN